MKIAIMTQPLGQNYGGMMQAWALQQVLIRMGHEAVTIDRQYKPKGALYSIAILAYRTLMKSIGRRKLEANLGKYFTYIFQDMQNFIKDNIRLSDPIYGTKELKEHFKIAQYDAVIVGSDQVWRPSYSPCIENFFLDFLEGWQIKRIAYAASFGVSEWEYTEQQTKRCAQLIKHFDAVSVREDSAVELCRRHFGLKAAHVLDPTLLLRKEDYLQLIKEQGATLGGGSGILTYFLDETREKTNVAGMVSNQLGATVYSCQAKRRATARTAVYDLNDYRMPDPREWLAGFASAKFVLTDSFHGVVFSILFHKPFIVIGNKRRGLSRFRSILNELGLLDRLVMGPDDIDFSGLLEVDWDLVGTKLSSLRKQSADFWPEAFRL